MSGISGKNKEKSCGVCRGTSIWVWNFLGVKLCFPPEYPGLN